MVAVGSMFFLVAFILLLSARRKQSWVQTTKQQYHIADGSITYSDLNIPARPLFSPRYQITGKPDYIVEKDHRVFPVEVKTGAHTTPLKNHVLQLATYCQLLEDAYDVDVPYGLLVYESGSFTIPFTPLLRYEIATSVEHMRLALRKGTIHLNHHDLRRCKACSFHRYCDKRLV